MKVLFVNFITYYGYFNFTDCVLFAGKELIFIGTYYVRKWTEIVCKCQHVHIYHLCTYIELKIFSYFQVGDLGIIGLSEFMPG